jgi:signal transduction histidine kinase
MDKKEPHHHLRDFILIATFAMVGTGLMVYVDAFDWFYRHSRAFEKYDYDEIVVFLLLFGIVGTLFSVFRLYRRAIRGDSHRRTGQPAKISIFSLFDYFQKLGVPLSASYKTPLILVLSLGLIIVCIEIADMFLLKLLPPLPTYLVAILDSVILVVLISPALYFMFFKPLASQFILREQTEKQLHQFNLELENRIAQRTVQLREELAERTKIEEKLREHQEHLHALSGELARVSERERQRIANDLHDNIGQNLALANNKLRSLADSASDDQRERLQEDIQQLVEKSIRYSRALISELSSPILEQLSFESGLEWLAEEVLQKNGISADLAINCDTGELSTESRGVFLKAIRELLVNAVKHAQASRVRVTASNSGQGLLVTIKDDGIGFDLSSCERPRGGRTSLGLFSVRERVSRLNGSVSITSRPGRGTEILLIVPTTSTTEDLTV